MKQCRQITCESIIIREPGYLCQYSVCLRTGRPEFDPQQRQIIFLLASASRLALGPTQPPVQWVPEVLSPGVKRGRGVMLTTRPHLVPTLRMSRCNTSYPPQAPSWRVARQLYFFFTINHHKEYRSFRFCTPWFGSTARYLYIVYEIWGSRGDEDVSLPETYAMGRGGRYSSYSFLTSALDRGEWSASRPGRALPPGKGPPVPIG
jgi:hypothetical protein